MAVEYHLLTENGAAGAYWASLPENDPGNGGNYRARYYNRGAYQVFGRMFDWENQLIANKSYATALDLEIQGKWDDTYNNYTAGHQLAGYGRIRISTLVNGRRDPDSFHGGRPGGGYRRIDTYNASGMIRNANLNTVIDGVEFVGSASTCLGAVLTVDTTIRNCIFGGNKTGKGLSNGAGHVLVNNIFHGFTTGIELAGYTNNCRVVGNLVTNCDLGFSAANTYIAFVYNNIAIGNVTNWGTPPNDGVFSHNAGEAGNAVWQSAGAVKITGIVPADFKSYVSPLTAASDFRPAGDPVAHTTASQLVEAGMLAYPELGGAVDMLGAARPSHKNGAATAPDIGPFEFDWGYGLAPQQVPLTFSGMAEGSVLAVYKTDGSAIVAPTTIGAGGSHALTYSYTGDTQILVRVRKGTGAPKYLPYEAPGLITASGFALIVNQVEDPIA